MDYITVETKYGTINVKDSEMAEFLISSEDTTFMELFNLDENDLWLKKDLFMELPLSQRAYVTIKQSFDERDESKQTLEYVCKRYTPASLATRRNVGITVLKEFMILMRNHILAEDKKSGKQRIFRFDQHLIQPSIDEHRT